VTRDIEEELAVASGMSELVFRWTTQRDTAKDEGSGVVGKFLAAGVAGLADQADGLQLFELELGETNRRQNGLK